MANKEAAKRKVDEFAARTDAGKWPNLSRAEIAATLRTRVDNPDTISQRNTSLCGAASFFHELAGDDPETFVQTAIDLYEKGQATIGSLIIKPGGDVMKFKLGTNGIAQGDWILAASLRDSGNWFVDYQSTGDDAAAITFPSTLANWFKNAGYQDVRNDTNLVKCKDFKNATEANGWKKKAYHVCLFISAKMLEREHQAEASVYPDHWIVLLEPVKRVDVDCCEFTCFTWGRQWKVPEDGIGRLRIKHFEWNYYGYIACKY